MAIPTDTPEWDTNDTNSTEPPAQFKTDGLPEGVPLPFSYLNWQFGRIWLWISWLASDFLTILFGAQHNTTTGAHTSVTADDVTATNDLTTTAGDVVADAGDLEATLGEVRSAAGGMLGGAVPVPVVVDAYADTVASGPGSAPVAETSLRDFVIPPNTWQAGRGFRLNVAYHVGSYGVGNPTLDLRVRLGPTATALAARHQCEVIARATTEPQAGSCYGWINLNLILNSIGASSLGAFGGVRVIDDTAIAGQVLPVVDRSGGGWGAGVIDTTVEMTLSVTHQWSSGAGSAGDLGTITLEAL